MILVIHDITFRGTSAKVFKLKDGIYFGQITSGNGDILYETSPLRTTDYWEVYSKITAVALTGLGIKF